MGKNPEFHGSDVEKVTEYYNISPEEIIMFGANVNPLGLSDAVKERIAANLDIICSYPDRKYTELKKTIGEYCHADPAHIVVGNGSTELISLLISQRKAKKAVVLGPTYSEYARELTLTGGKTIEYHLKESEDFILNIEDFLTFIPADTDLVILCNPNNPTSSAVKNDDMKHILSACQERNIFVMIDETYVEFSPTVADITAVPLVKNYDNLMVIRGVSKFYAAPGLRFGYGITSNAIFLQEILTHQNPWSLNSIGAFAGEWLLKDTDYIQRTRELICSQREYMYHTLSDIPHLKAYKPYGNFILVRLLKEGLTSFDVFESAIKENMMIRDCSSFKGLKGEYIRFCIMLPEDNERLMECIKKAVAS